MSHIRGAPFCEVGTEPSVLNRGVLYLEVLMMYVLTGFLILTVRSTTEQSGTGTLNAIPVSFLRGPDIITRNAHAHISPRACRPANA